VSILVAIGVNQDGHREVLGVAEGTKEDKASWQGFLRYLKERGLKGVRLFVGDKCLGLVESLAECYPAAAYQRWVVHFYRNVWSLVPATKVRTVATMLKAIHASEDRAAARTKAAQVVDKLRGLKLPAAATLIAEHIEETFSYYAFPTEHQRSLRVTIHWSASSRDPPAHPRRRRLPRRQQRPDPRRGALASRGEHPVGPQTLYGHEPAQTRRPQRNQHARATKRVNFYAGRSGQARQAGPSLRSQRPLKTGTKSNL
jgi:hypothetical protein